MSSYRVGGRVVIDRRALEKTPLYAGFPNAPAANGHVNFKRTRGSWGWSKPRRCRLRVMHRLRLYTRAHLLFFSCKQPRALHVT